MKTNCPHCHTPVKHIHDQPKAGIPITINTQPTTWTGALQAIATGRAAVYTALVRGDRGGAATEHWRLTDWRINAGPQRGDSLHTQHQCGTTDPAAATSSRAAPEGPGY